LKKHFKCIKKLEKENAIFKNQLQNKDLELASLKEKLEELSIQRNAIQNSGDQEQECIDSFNDRAIFSVYQSKIFDQNSTGDIHEETKFGDRVSQVARDHEVEQTQTKFANLQKLDMVRELSNHLELSREEMEKALDIAEALKDKVIKKLCNNTVVTIGNIINLLILLVPL